MPKYLLLLRDSGEFPAGLGADEIRGIIQRYVAWSDRLRAAGRLLAAEKLRDGEGRVMRRTGSRNGVTDGPFSEAKEVVGGFYLLDAGSYEEAVRLAEDSPHLEFGSIEIREIESL
ncbi:MAG TPA: YciI family protein [Gemmatimonadales bacterium]|nr:YciI family protein [Gemmatimonadales bacterium]